MSTTYGLEWKQYGFEVVPEFTVEPDPKIVEQLVRAYMPVPGEVKCMVEAFEEGTFNKIFQVNFGCNSIPYIMRVGLPIDAPYKVLSEVATIRYLRSNVCTFITA
jgi:hypothetical protein